MTNVDRPISMVFFHDFPGSAESRATVPDPADESIDYLQARERFERSAAKRARSVKARQVHQELAQHYAEKARRAAIGGKSVA